MADAEILDFAIVGGGIAGLYAAHRLLGAGNENIHVFETSERLGGRLLTVDMPGVPFRAELGGMRFLDRHLLVNHLVQELGLGVRPFGFAGTKKLMYLRGCHIHDGEDCKYKLDRAERGMRCDELVTHAIRTALREVKLDFGADDTPHADPAEIRRECSQLELRLRLLSRDLRVPDEAPEAEESRLPGEKLAFGIDYFTAREWELIKRFGKLRSTRLYQIGFWNLLQHYLSSEGFLFLHDALGYESIVLNWNAAEAMQWFLRDFSGSYRTLVNGMQMLTNTIHWRYSKDRQEIFSLKHQLQKIEWQEQGGVTLWKLEFKVKSSATSDAPATSKTVLARNVILALPAAALKSLEFPEIVTEPPVRLMSLLEQVKAQRLFKLFLGYSEVWWNDPRGVGGASGTANTDLPIRQVYYWGADKATDPDTTKGMVMASYSDSHYVDFWEPMHRTPLDDDYFYEAPKEDLTEPEIGWLKAYGVSRNMVEKAHRQIRMLHPELSMADRIPRPVVALVKDWPDGWHAWRVHAQPWLAMKQLKRPLLGQNLFICGEAYSEDQGWVEGALRSVELVLQQLGIRPPEIRPESYRHVGYAGYTNYIGNWPDLDG